jgi:hypothetical protein
VFGTRQYWEKKFSNTDLFALKQHLLHKKKPALWQEIYKGALQCRRRDGYVFFLATLYSIAANMRQHPQLGIITRIGTH